MPICTTDTLIKPRSWAVPVEQTDDARGRWELSLNMPYDKDVALGKAILAPMSANGLFSVRSWLTLTHDGYTSPGLTADAEGELFPDEARFDLHLIDPEGSVPPFQCVLQATTPGEAYEGTWSIPCRDPIECGCGGMSEKMWLVKCGDDGAPGDGP